MGAGTWWVAGRMGDELVGAVVEGGLSVVAEGSTYIIGALADGCIAAVGGCLEGGGLLVTFAGEAAAEGCAAIAGCAVESAGSLASFAGDTACAVAGCTVESAGSLSSLAGDAACACEASVSHSSWFASKVLEACAEVLGEALGSALDNVAPRSYQRLRANEEHDVGEADAFVQIRMSGMRQREAARHVTYSQLDMLPADQILLILFTTPQGGV